MCLRERGGERERVRVYERQHEGGRERGRQRVVLRAEDYVQRLHENAKADRSF